MLFLWWVFFIIPSDHTFVLFHWFLPTNQSYLLHEMPSLWTLFFFKLLLSHSLKILVIFCRNIFAVLYWSANHTSGQWDHWEQSCLPLLCLPSLCSWCPPHSALLRIVPVRKRMMKNALSKLAFLSKPTGFDILPHLSTASRGKSTKIFFTLFLRFLFC